MKCSGPTRRQAASRVMVPVCQVAEARFIRPAQGVMSMPPASPQWLCNRRQFSVAASRHILPCPTLLPPANVHAQENSQLTGPESCCRTACCVLSVIPCIGLGGFTSVAANTSSAVFRFGKLEVSVEHPRASCASQCVMCVHAHQWVYALRCVRLGVCVCIVCRRTAPPSCWIIVGSVPKLDGFQAPDVRFPSSPSFPMSHFISSAPSIQLVFTGLCRVPRCSSSSWAPELTKQARSVRRNPLGGPSPASQHRGAACASG